jgi:hypothetical protein
MDNAPWRRRAGAGAGRSRYVTGASGSRMRRLGSPSYEEFNGGQRTVEREAGPGRSRHVTGASGSRSSRLRFLR